LDTRTLLAKARTVLDKVVENWPAKALSIALALILFVVHQRNTQEERVFSAPLQVEIDSHVVPANPYPKMIRITVRGDAARVRSLAEADIEPYIDLKGKGRGLYRPPVQFRKKGAAQDLEPLEIQVEPLEISLTLDNKISKYVPLRANTQGSPKPGYELVNFTLNPAQVILDGPSDLMTSITELSTDVIELDGRSEDFSIMVTILNQNPLVSIRGNTMIEFNASIKQIIRLENFDGLPISIIGLPERFTADLEIKTGMVRLGGSQEDLEQYRPPASLLSLDGSAISQAGTYTLPLTVQVAPGFTLLRQEPETVTVHIRNRGGDL
jgi:YbbR domain-containing protein